MNLLVPLQLAAAVIVLTILWIAYRALKWAAEKEAEALIPETTRGLLERAKTKLPPEARARFGEELPAGLEKAIEKRPLWALRQAISFYAGARRLARELEPAVVTAGSGRAARAGSAAVARGSDLIRGGAWVRAWADTADKWLVSKLIDPIAMSLDHGTLMMWILKFGSLIEFLRSGPGILFVALVAVGGMRFLGLF